MRSAATLQRLPLPRAGRGLQGHARRRSDATQNHRTALRYGYELDKKQSQIALLTKSRELQRQQSARQRQQLYLLLAGLVGVAVAAGLLWRTSRLKQRANRRLGEKNEEIAHQRDALDQAFLAL
jgi:two-component system NtrC family sensor kinase